MRRFRIPFRAITEQDVASVTGMTHDQAIRTVFSGLKEEELDVLTSNTASEHNRVLADAGGQLYPGVTEGLNKLADKFDLYIVSNCQSGYIETFLGGVGSNSPFLDFECWGNTGLSKAENLRKVIARNGLRSPVFVGDTAGDYDAAKENGIPFVQVTYGFGQPLEGAPAVESFESLVNLLVGFWPNSP